MSPHQNQRQNHQNKPHQEGAVANKTPSPGLPDGFYPMNTAPKDRAVRLVTESGHVVTGKIKNSRNYDNINRRWVSRSLWADPITGTAIRVNPIGWKEV